VAKGANRAAKTLLPVVQTVIDREVKEMRTLMGGRQTVIMTFSTTRREAREYVEKNGYEQAKQFYQNSKQALESWQNSMNAALQAEAGELAKSAVEATTDFLARMQRVHGTFVDEFKGILIESVSDKAIDVLADRPFYEEWADGITRLDMDQQLRQLYGSIYEMNGNIDRAFGEFATFNELPVESQYMVQQMVMRFESDVKKPFTSEMQEALKTLEEAKNKQPTTIAKEATRAALDLARQAAGS
jgi:tetratricopeptide (TPR) repeat protein